jgi:two-component sensor histidine kinase/tetratricopeptide (TPR) repeat protein
MYSGNINCQNQFSEPYPETRIKEVLASDLHDTLKAQEVFAYINQIRLQDVEQAEAYTKEFYKIVKRANYKTGLGFYYLTCAETALFQKKTKPIIDNAQKAAIIFKEVNLWQNFLVATDIICSGYTQSNDYNEVIKTANAALELTKNYNLPIQKTSLYKDLAFAYRNLNQFKKAIFFYEKAIATAYQTNNYEAIFAVHSELIFIYNQLGLYEQALQEANTALKLKEKVFVYYPENLALLHLRTSNSYSNLKQYKLAIKELEAAKKITSIEAIKLYCDTRIALNYFFLDDYNKSLNIAKKTKENIPDYYTAAICNYCLALNYFKKGDNRLSEIYFNDALRNINLPGVKKFFEEYNIIADCKKHLSEIALTDNDYEKSHILMQEALAAENEKVNLIKDLGINEIAAKVDLAQKKEEVNKLTEESAEKQLEIESGQKKAFMLIASLFIALLILLLIYRSYRNKKRNSEQLTIRNEIIENQKNELERNLSEKNLLIKEIHHRVKNNFQMVISMLNLQVSADNVTDINQFLEEATSRILSMALIHESLYNTENLDEINFKKYVDELIESMIAAYNNSENRLSFNIDIPDYTIDIQTAIPLGLILNEMILNTIKYVQPGQLNTIIAIRLHLSDNKEFILQYFDNGRVFKSTEKRKGSFGTELITLLVEQIKGQLIIENKPGVTYKVSFSNKNNAIV